MSKRHSETDEGGGGTTVCDCPTMPVLSLPDPTDDPVQQQASDGPTLADIFQPASRFSIADIAERLSIPLFNLLHTVKNDGGQCINNYFGTWGSEGMFISGAAAVALVKQNHLPYKISDAAIRLWKRQQPEPKPEPKPEATKGLVGEAFDELAARQRADAAGDNEDRRLAFDAYLALLLRHDQPHPDDAQRLADRAEELQLTKEQVEADISRIQEARKLLALRDQRTQASAVLPGLIAERERFEKASVVGLKERRKAVERARSHSYQCDQATYELERLARERPQLFDVSVSPPALRSGVVERA